jgi:hypothetical protein
VLAIDQSLSAVWTPTASQSPPFLSVAALSLSLSDRRSGGRWPLVVTLIVRGKGALKTTTSGKLGTRLMLNSDEVVAGLRELRSVQGVGQERVEVTINPVRKTAVIEAPSSPFLNVCAGVWIPTAPQCHCRFWQVEMETMSWAEQTSAVAQSDLLVGMHGAGMTHLLWLPPSSGVVQMMNFGATTATQ